jgi:hypothetical protein
LTGAIMTLDRGRGDLLKVAASGVLSGLLTPLMQPLVDRIDGAHGDFRIALLALPFAILVLILVRRADPRWWVALGAAIVTMLAFVCAVNAAILVDARVFDVGKFGRNTLAGLAGGLIGSGLMALGIGLLTGARGLAQWRSMLIVGTVAGSLLAVDNALGFDLFSVLYPVWQAAVAAGLLLALRRTQIA